LRLFFFIVQGQGIAFSNKRRIINKVFSTVLSKLGTTWFRRGGWSFQVACRGAAGLVKSGKTRKANNFALAA